MKSYWLFKSEPDAFSLSDLKNESRGVAFWDGVRNYQARNFLRDSVSVGDGVLFYHSRIKEPAVVGLAEVVKAGYPDPTQFDVDAEYFDPKSDPEKPRWYGVEIRYAEEFERAVTLKEIKEMPSLSTMALVNRSRLSIQPVLPEAWTIICGLGGSSA